MNTESLNENVEACINPPIEWDQTAEAARILLKTDDFLMVFLSYLVNSEHTISDSLLTSPKVLQSILEYSVRNFLMKSLAEEFCEMVPLTDDHEAERHSMQTNNSSNSKDTENHMIMVLLHAFPKFMLSSEYRAWCLRIMIAKNTESRMMRSVIEMNHYESNIRRWVHNSHQVQINKF